MIEGIPELVDRLERGVPLRALGLASCELEFGRAALGGDAVVVGAAALAMRSFVEEKE